VVLPSFHLGRNVVDDRAILNPCNTGFVLWQEELLHGRGLTIWLRFERLCVRNHPHRPRGYKISDGLELESGSEVVIFAA
jgi:hypothetical protein